MNLIDANVFIRYLIGDDAAKQQKSKDLIERIRTGQEEAFTTEVIVFSTSGYLRRHLGALVLGVVFVLCGSGVAPLGPLWVGGNDVMAHRLSIGEFVQFNAYLGQLAWPMIALGWSFNLLQRGDASLTRIREVTERAPAIADRPCPVPAHPFVGEIEFQHVSLCYGEHEVLHDISLRIPAGATLALVGPTGAGKTSLMNLLPRTGCVRWVRQMGPGETTCRVFISR